MRFGSGSGAGELPRCWWVSPVLLVVGLVGVVVALFGVVSLVRASCTIVPEIPLVARTNDICQALNRGRPDPGCQWRVKRYFNIEIVPAGSQPESAYFELYIRGDYIGSFAIPEAIPVDLTTLDAGIINRLLQYRLGPQEVQDAIQQKYGRRGVFYIDRIVEWIQPPIEGQPAYLAGVGALGR